MLPEIIQQTLIITAFVMVMMLIIEVINVQSSGKWFDRLTKRPALQNLIGTALGGLPGCLGTYTAVSLYSHKGMNFAALLTTMIVTTGDEAFLMLSLIPLTFLKISLTLIVIGLVVGFSWYKLKLGFGNDVKNKHQFEVHHNHECIHWENTQILKQLKNISFPRAVLMFSLALFLWGILSGGIQHAHAIFPTQATGVEMAHTEQVIDHAHDGHNHEGHTHELHQEDLSNAPIGQEAAHNHDHFDWFSITLVAVSIIAFLLIAIVPDHFLEDHLWNHIIKKHALKIFIWTLLILSLIFFLEKSIDLNSWVSNNYFKVLLLAVIVGLIPQSGPHYIFILLFFQGSIPLSILLANSIVQDGHGALPLLAESKKSFFQIKAIKFILGLIIGLIGFLML